MSTLLQPAISLANRMSFSAKLLCVVLIFLLPFIWLLTKQLYSHNRAIFSAEQVEQGVGLALRIKPVALEIAKHRGTMAQYLNGAKDKADSLRAIEATVDQQLQQLLVELEPLNKIAAEFGDIQRQWQSLKLASIGADAGKSFVLHTQLIGAIQQQLIEVVDHFGIELISTRDQYYLMQLVLFQIPELQELLGQ